MMLTKEELEREITEYAKADLLGAISLISGLFVGLNEVYIKINKNAVAGDENKEIRINIGHREITIHPTKKIHASKEIH